MHARFKGTYASENSTATERKHAGAPRYSRGEQLAAHECLQAVEARAHVRPVAHRADALPHALQRAPHGARHAVRHAAGHKAQQEQHNDLHGYKHAHR